ncbi:MAG: 50S ribosomal protein L10 [Sulfurimonas sp. RIFCSPHIGHO2_12_FULL_36_9]|jgi:large subunit ribosomal protein L10|uniref:50S ribosomal protein L10 n=1 Tax=unclassified Sulfurimonas TaxID=2623549 RepID=UPI0008B5A7F7|nr:MULTISPECIES: 50S ribosomal protein L10 [unclassified Sulfurimonas]OHD97028.1 MAG: 50S ribosomal protein L10 [Sulfurimonas sp. RIFCSPHIGHO2_12_FULL_36_9]OHE00933.1 MAG: 50S ribosomal protein L10 [Sulfurimonas sp. RIFCSPLOWO2_02_FULL_36_28]OHE01673.1 MAG: 50S ribosomal protein L10 [Sulfurimonas sp. RIFCSPLOWO2_12_36_12]OHE07727.1 MAG: 50S ribosomal protein L10 [Sulfurimonas sp. RIFCSPLOWO2_12_FULL_36_74]
MTKTQKAEIIEVLSNEFKDAQSVIFCDYKGLGVSKLENLRKMARAKDAKVQVVKNTLATIALANAELTGVELKDTNILVWGADSVATSKVVADFAKDNDQFIIKSAYVDRAPADAAKVEAFAKLPGREELLAMLAATWMAPITCFTIGLDALRQKKEA